MLACIVHFASSAVKSWFKRTSEQSGTPFGEASQNTDRLVDELIATGQKLEDEGEPERALAKYVEAIGLQPASSTAHLNAGNAHRALQDNNAAIDMYRRAAKLNPCSAAAQFNLGNALLAERTHASAETAYREALKLRPEWAEAWIGLGCALEERGAVDDAIDAYKRALTFQPSHAGAASNLSMLQINTLDMTGARSTLCEFLRHVPDDRQLLQQLATVEESSGRLEESVAVLRALVERQPDDFTTWSRLLFHSSYLPEMSAEENLREHRRFGQFVESSVIPLRVREPRTGNPDRRLRIGYVSGDFNIHPVANFIHPVLRNHNRQDFEVFCYHTKNNADRLTAELNSITDHWRNVTALDDDALANQIRSDGIDILVDLAGHTAANRLPMFARKPAPVQVTWLGYLGTTGLSRMDYRLCDAHTDPPGVAEHWHAENLMRMPVSQWCYDQRLVRVPDATPLPRLRRGYWTFGSFNNYRKLNDRVFSAWARILQAVPNSRLRLFSFESAESGERARSALTSLGVDRSRVDWVMRTGPEGHFDSFSDVDIALDSFPYNGATTTCDALLMGVPVLAVAGSRSISRGALSLLNAVGMPDWVAESEEQLAALAQERLASVDTIAHLRSTLPQRMRESALMDASAFTRHLEELFRTAWRLWYDRANSPDRDKL